MFACCKITSILPRARDSLPFCAAHDKGGTQLSESFTMEEREVEQNLYHNIILRKSSSTLAFDLTSIAPEMRQPVRRCRASPTASSGKHRFQRGLTVCMAAKEKAEITFAPFQEVST